MLETMASQAKTTTHAKASEYAGKRVHLIGVGGSGMRALAHMLLVRGAAVSGSDREAGEAIDGLAASGAKVFVGQRAENLPDKADLVVHSAAINDQNVELAAARARGVEVLKYSQMLGRLMQDTCGIAVAGTHGKSTTSGMMAYALSAAGRSPSFIVGATVTQLSSPSGVGRGPHFVAEACEYDRSFLNLCPTLAAILNIEEDHLDYFPDLAAIVGAFHDFAAKLPPHGVLIANGQDENVAEAVRNIACEVQTFGVAEHCRWRAENLHCQSGLYSFDIVFDGKLFTHIDLLLAGLHNATNALAAAALLHHAGLSGQEISKALGAFEGTQRRMTVKAQIRGMTVVDDYAHHPTEIQVTLKAIRERFTPRRLVCVFQPHQHSRTRFLLKDFARSFAAADRVIVPDIYFVRDSQLERDHISAADLVAQIRLNGRDAQYLKDFASIARHLEESLAPGDLVVTMGAGNIWEVADEIVRWLGSDR